MLEFILNRHIHIFNKNKNDNLYVRIKHKLKFNMNICIIINVKNKYYIKNITIYFVSKIRRLTVFISYS